MSETVEAGRKALFDKLMAKNREVEALLSENAQLKRRINALEESLETARKSVKVEIAPSAGWKLLSAKFAGRCLGCEDSIFIGETVHWKHGLGSVHVRCFSSYMGRRTRGNRKRSE